MSKVRSKYIPNVDLRAEMINLTNETAYEVLLQRCSHKIRCSCYNNKYHEADARCPKCLGTGWLFQFEKLSCFKQDLTANGDGNILFTSVGKAITGYSKFFFKWDDSVTQKDYIWEVAFKNGKPVRLINLYQIEEVSEQRGIDGRVEYKICIAKNEPFDKDFKNMYIGKAWREIK